MWRIAKVGQAIPASNAWPADLVSIPRDMYGVRIGARSELDEILLVSPQGNPPIYTGGGQNGEVVNTGDNVIDKTIGGAPTSTVFRARELSIGTVENEYLISVARPFLGHIPAGKYRLQWTRRAFATGFSSADVIKQALIELEFAEAPWEAVGSICARAPFSCDASYRVPFGTSIQVFWPLFGRSHLAVDVFCTRLSGAGNMQVSLDSIVNPFAADLGGSLGVASPVDSITPLLAATGIAASASIQYDASIGPVDWLRATVTKLTAGEGELAFHVRADD